MNDVGDWALGLFKGWDESVKASICNMMKNNKYKSEALGYINSETALASVDCTNAAIEKIKEQRLELLRENSTEQEMKLA